MDHETKIQLEYLGLTAGDLDDLKSPFDGRTPQDLREPHMHLLRLMRNPDYFYFTAKVVCGIELSPFQCVILKEMWERRFPMLIGSRGMGKSFLLGLYAVLRALLKQGSKVVICGSGFRQAKTVFNYAAKIWRDSEMLRSLVGEGGENGVHQQADRWILRLGDSTITALPIGTGEKIRGERANCIIVDEFASVPKDIFETVIAGFGVVNLSPITQAKKRARIRVMKRDGVIDEDQARQMKEEDGGNQIIISGTAYYQFNHFCDYWKKWKQFIESQGDMDKLRVAFGGEVDEGFNWKNYAIIRVPSDMLPEGYYDEDQIARSRATIHSGTFANEFGAVFSSDSNGFYKRSLIQGCVTTIPITPNTPRGMPVTFKPTLRGSPVHSYVMAIDPASENDNFAIVILEIHEDHRRIVHAWTTDKQRFNAKVKSNQIEEHDYYGYCARKIRDLLKAFPCEVISLDAQGGGVAVLEALHDPDKLRDGEKPIWTITPDHSLSDGKERETDDRPGLHIVELVQFARADYVAGANHGMRKDFEDRVLLFPREDPVMLAEAQEDDHHKKRIFDTLEDCVDEIEDLKDELATIEHTQTPGSLRDKWDTPEVKVAGSKKGRLRKDRYSALLMANYAARRMHRRFEMPEIIPHGGFVSHMIVNEKHGGDMYSFAPDWFVKQSEGNYDAYGWAS